MYEMTGCVRYSEAGEDNRLKTAGIINYFQDCTTENSEHLGVGHAFLRKRTRAWILNAWQVFINRRPSVGEEVRVSTWATGFKGIMGPRDFKMVTADGEELACAQSLWVYVDTETGKPVRPTDGEIAAYEVEEPLPIANFSRKISLPEGLSKVDTFPVRKYHIDTNNHMNNSRYVELACEALPQNFEAKILRVEYKKAAVYGDQIILKCAVEEERFVCVLCNEESETYATVEFIGETK